MNRPGRQALLGVAIAVGGLACSTEQNKGDQAAAPVPVVAPAPEAGRPALVPPRPAGPAAPAWSNATCEQFNDGGHECGDVAGKAARGAKAGSKRSDLCLSTLECILSKGCSTDDVAICYCGSLGAGNACTVATSGANGPCMQREVDGLEHMASEAPKAVVPDFTNPLLGSGVANQFFACARVNGCAAFCKH